jgi:hypothetical protein
MHAARPSYAVRHSRSVLIVIIAALLLGLVPAAHASTPDPTWIGGYWDDDDFDNAVISMSVHASSRHRRLPTPRRSGIVSPASSSQNQRSSSHRLDPLLPPALRR